MNRNHTFSFIVSLIAMWAICYLFNTTAVTGKVVLSKTFISPWLTYTSVSKYLTLGFGLKEWLASACAVLLLLFIWGALYFFVYSVKRALDIGRLRR